MPVPSPQTHALVRAPYARTPACLLLQQGLLDPRSLEDLTGLTELHRASEAALEAWASSDEDVGDAGPRNDAGGAAAGAAAAGASDDGEAGKGEEDWEEL